MEQKEEFEEEEPQSFECEQCGKNFPNLNSLKAHKLRSHRIYANLSKPKSKAVEEKPVAEEEKVILPTQADFFSENLEACGLSQQQIQQILVKASEIDLNDLYQVYALLKEFNLTRDKIRLIINLWSVKQHLPIPPDLRNQLGILISPQPITYQYQAYPEYASTVPPTPSSARKLESENYSLSNILVAMLQQQTNLITTLLQSKNNKSDDAEKSLLIQELKEQKEKLEKMEQELKQKELEKLEDVIVNLSREIEEIKKAPASDGYKTDEIRLAAEAVNRLANALEENKPIKEIKEFMMELIKISGEEKVPEELKKKIEETASGVATMVEQINPEYVAEK